MPEPEPVLCRFKPNRGAQEDFLRSNAKFPALIMGQGGGKTWGGAAKLVLLHCHFPVSNSLVIMPTYTLLQQVAIPAITEHFDRFEIPYHIRLNPLEIETPTQKSRIFFRSGTHPEHITALEVGRAWIDELARIPRGGTPVKNVWYNALARIRDPSINARFRQLFVTGTHEGVTSLMYEKWEKEPKPGYVVYRGSTRENPSMQAQAAMMLDEYGPELARQYVEGYAVEDSSAAMAWADILACQTETCARVLDLDRLRGVGGPIFVGMDIGRSQSLTVFWAIRKAEAGHWETLGLLELRDTDFAAQAEHLNQIARVPGVACIAIDATYNPQTTEDAVAMFGEHPRGQILPVVFTAVEKVSLVQRLSKAVRSRNLWMPVGDDLTNDLYGLKRIVSPKGIVTYAAPFTADGHSDRAMAAALALRAAVEDAGLIETKLGPKLRTAGLRRF
jgi:hypothetical protein